MLTADPLSLGKRRSGHVGAQKTRSKCRRRFTVFRQHIPSGWVVPVAAAVPGADGRGAPRRGAAPWIPKNSHRELFFLPAAKAAPKASSPPAAKMQQEGIDC